MRILVVNAGSSSLKLSVLDGDDLVAAHDIKMSPGSRIDETSSVARRPGGADQPGRPPDRPRRN